MVEELPFKQRVAGSTPAIPRKIRGVAQRLEQLPDTQPVEGSIPSAPTTPVQYLSVQFSGRGATDACLTWDQVAAGSIPAALTE